MKIKNHLKTEMVLEIKNLNLIKSHKQLVGEYYSDKVVFKIAAQD